MDSLKMARELGVLVKLDIDAVHAYGQAIILVETIGIRDNLLRFQKDHERHIEQLSAVIRALDAEPPEYTLDFKGFLSEGFTLVSGISETRAILETIKINEELTNQKYREGYALDFTPNIRELVGYNYHDEQAHLRFIEEVLAAGPWERC